MGGNKLQEYPFCGQKESSLLLWLVTVARPQIEKKRGAIIPSESGDNTYQTVMAKKEGFWSALLRSKDEKLPEGMVDLE